MRKLILLAYFALITYFGSTFLTNNIDARLKKFDAQMRGLVR